MEVDTPLFDDEASPPVGAESIAWRPIIQGKRVPLAKYLLGIYQADREKWQRITTKMHGLTDQMARPEEGTTKMRGLQDRMGELNVRHEALRG